MAHSGGNKCRNQLYQGPGANAPWFVNNKQKRRKHRKIAKASKRRNRGK